MPSLSWVHEVTDEGYDRSALLPLDRRVREFIYAELGRSESARAEDATSVQPRMNVVISCKLMSGANEVSGGDLEGGADERGAPLVPIWASRDEDRLST